MTIAIVRSETIYATDLTIDVGSVGDRSVDIYISGEQTSNPVTNVAIDGNNCTRVANACAVNSNGTGTYTERWYADESILDGSTGSVDIVVSSSSGIYNIIAMLMTGVQQGGPVASRSASLNSVTAVTMGSVTVPEGALVALGCVNGNTNSYTTATSPLVVQERIIAGSAVHNLVAGIEATQQVNKVYQQNSSASMTVPTGGLLVWAEGGFNASWATSANQGLIQ